jgi:hypothetical protein
VTVPCVLTAPPRVHPFVVVFPTESVEESTTNGVRAAAGRTEGARLPTILG